MSRHKHPAVQKKKPVPPPEPDFDAQAQALSDLALELVEHEDGDPAASAGREEELATLVRRALRRKHDEVLYGAIELARYTDADACRHLRTRIGEEASSMRIRRESGPELEIDAFMVPVFVRSSGGLAEQEAFRDDEAYAALLDSFRQGGLESRNANVVLVRHAYDPAEVERISYSQLHEMLREAAHSMASKKPAPVPLLEASMRGWSGQRFGPDEEAMELRFLLGFSLKRADDPFYAVPRGEAQADAYFDARMERYRNWTVDVRELVARSLARAPQRLTLDFLYQDLFFGARDQGMAELAMLGALAEVNRILGERGVAPAQVRAVVAPLDAGEQAVLRIHLYGPAGVLLGSAEKAVDLSADLAAEVDDMCDALATLGIADLATATAFGADGQPQDAARWQPG